MKRRWKLWCGLLLFAGLMVLFHPGDAQAASGDGWTLSEDGVLIIENDTGMSDWTDHSWAYHHVKSVAIRSGVTAISPYAFWQCNELSSVDIDEGVQDIGEYAFGGWTNLKSITIPASVTFIGDNAFTYNSIEYIMFTGNTPPVFGEDILFNSIALANIYVPAGSVEAYKAALNLSSYESIISGYIAAGGWKLADTGMLFIESDAGMSNWANYGGDYRSDVTSVIIQSGVSAISPYAFSGCDNLTGVTIPVSVQTIGDYAFCQCGNLTGVTIPALVQTIGAYAFMECTNLTDVTIPASVQTIGGSAFLGSGLITATFAGVTPPVFGTYVFQDTDGTLTVIYVPYFSMDAYKAADNLPSFVTGAISARHIAAGTGWTLELDGSLIIESNTGMNNWFYAVSANTQYREYVTHINIKSGVTQIGESAFANCSGLMQVSIPNTVETIESGAFTSCTGLTTVILSASVETVGHNVFSGCTGLTTVIFLGSLPTSLGTGMFTDCSMLANIYVPASAVDAYKNAAELSGYADMISAGYIDAGNGWTLDSDYKLIIKSDSGMADWCSNGSTRNSSYVKTVKIQSGVTAVSAYAFNNCQALNSVSIPDSVTGIGAWAFGSCYDLTAISIPDAVTGIGAYAFTGCNHLENVSFGSMSRLETIGEGAFAGCFQLSGISLPASVTDIGNCVFMNCSDLTDISIGSLVETIGSSAFEGCTALQSVTFSSATPPSSIGINIFNNCNLLESIRVLAGSVGAYQQALGSYAWLVSDGPNIASGADWVLNSVGRLTIKSDGGMADWIQNGTDYHGDVTALEIQSEVTAIGDYAFSGCSQLTAISIPDTVMGIGNYAFSGCSQLTSISIPDMVAGIGSNAFNGCSSLTGISIGSFVEMIGDHAFGGCTVLFSVTFSGVTPPSFVGTDIFLNCELLECIYTPSGSMEAYQEVLAGYADLICDGPNINEGTDWVLYSNGRLVIRSDSGMADWQHYSWSEYVAALDIEPGVTSIGAYSFAQYTVLRKVSIPDTVTTIGDYAFAQCTALTGVTLPDSVETIGAGAFAMSGFTSLHVPEGVTSIGPGAFAYCPSLTAFTVDEFNTSYSVEEGILYNKDKTALVSYPAGKTESSFIAPGTVTDIVSGAFAYASNLNSILIPERVETIGEGAFSDCTGLTSIRIPETVSELGDYVFNKCTGLTYVIFSGSTPPTVGAGLFTLCNGLSVIYVPEGSVTAYQAVFSTYSVIPLSDAETPEITHQPVSQTMIVGGSAALTVSASVENGNLSYQWYSNIMESTSGGAEIEGATQASYTVPTEATGTLYYYCVITNTDISVMGSQTTSITTQAAAVTVTEVSNYTVTVVNGSGSGSYTENTTVTITANAAPSGQVFSRWTVTGNAVLADPYSSSTGFTMPAGAVTVTAVYSTVYIPPATGGSDTSGSADDTDNSDGSQQAGDTGNNTITIAETLAGIRNTQLITVESVGEAFDSSVEIRLRDDPIAEEEIRAAIDAAVLNLDAEKLQIYPLDISLYLKGTDTKVQPKEGTSVVITCPVPEALLSDQENLVVVTVQNGELQVIPITLVTIDGVTCIRFTVTHFSPYAFAADSSNALTQYAAGVLAAQQMKVKTQFTVYAGARTKLNIGDIPKEAAVEYHVCTPTYASIDGGMLFAKKAGSAIIMASVTYKGKTTVYTVKVIIKKAKAEIAGDTTKEYVQYYNDIFTYDKINYRITSQATAAKEGTVAVANNQINGKLPKKVVIPATIKIKGKTYRVTSIDESAFYNRNSITSVSIPAGVTKISPTAFVSCDNLKLFKVVSGNRYYSARKGMLLNKAGTVLIAYPSARGTIELDSSITAIGAYAFSACKDLTEIIIPETVTRIEGCAFAESKALTKVVFRGDKAPAVPFPCILENVNESCNIVVPKASLSRYQYVLANARMPEKAVIQEE